MFQTLLRPGVLPVTLAAGGILMVTMGIRQTFGLFVIPMSESTGMTIASVSFAMAIGQFTWGAAQPVAGAVADQYGPRVVLLWGLVILAIGCAATPFMKNTFGLTFTLGLLASVGAGIGSFSVLIGAAAQRMGAESRGAASGVINAGGSLGQFVFAPIAQKLIQSIGWMGAIWALAITALATIPLIARVTKGDPLRLEQIEKESTLGLVVRGALKDPNYILLNAGFFTCGFHIAFLITHLPGEVNLCGLSPMVASWSLAIIGFSNIFGSLYSGSLVSKYRSKNVLAVMYASRALLVAWYLVMPREEWVFYLFAAGLGFTWLSTVPPTVAIVGKLFGPRFLATLFGITLLSHQIGGFLGAWLGGISITEYGDFTWMWYADLLLALFAAMVNLPIKEEPVVVTT